MQRLTASGSRRALHLVCALGLVALFGAMPPLARSQGAAVIRPDPALLEIGPGQTARVDIVLENAQDVYAIDLRLKYDPAVIEVLDADPAKEGVQAAPGAFLKPDFVVRNTADNTAGTLQYVITQVNPTAPASGTGVVLAFQVRGRQAGETPITFESVEMADRRGQTLAVTPSSGTIKVVAASAAPATETPPASSTWRLQHRQPPRLRLKPQPRRPPPRPSLRPSLPVGCLVLRRPDFFCSAWGP